MNITVRFWSYFKDMTACESMTATLPEGSTVGDLHDHLIARFPKLHGLRRSTLVAVGVDYALPTQPLKNGDEVSLFPPVQGG